MQDLKKKYESIVMVTNTHKQVMYQIHEYYIFKEFSERKINTMLAASVPRSRPFLNFLDLPL